MFLKQFNPTPPPVPQTPSSPKAHQRQLEEFDIYDPPIHLLLWLGGGGVKWKKLFSSQPPV